MPAVFRSWLRLSSQLVSIHCLLKSSRFHSVFTRFHGFHSPFLFPTRFPLSFSTVFSSFRLDFTVSTSFRLDFTLVRLDFDSVSQPFSRHFDSISRYPLPFDSLSLDFSLFRLDFTLLSTQWTPNRLLLCQHTPMPTSWNRLRLLNLRSPKSSDIWTLRKRNAMTT